MRNILMMLLVVFTFSSCKTNEKSLTKNVEKTTENYFSFYRSGCYGTCPSYKIVIQKNGNFVYFGKSNVENIGNYQGNLTKEQTEKLFSDLKTYKWEIYPGEYPVDNVDFPSFKFEYANGKILKTVRGNSNAAKELQELTIVIDSLILKLKLNKAN